MSDKSISLSEIDSSKESETSVPKRNSSRILSRFSLCEKMGNEMKKNKIIVRIFLMFEGLGKSVSAIVKMIS